MNTKERTPWQPSSRATLRVKDPAPVQATCHHCGGEVRIANNSEIYGEEYGKWPWVYLCTGCRSYVGMHPFTSIPLGTVANKEEREARKRVKTLFNMLWRRPGGFSRSEAYAWLAEHLLLEVSQCHFGLFNVEMCTQAEVIIDSRLQYEREERQRAREKKYGKKRKGAPK